MNGRIKMYNSDKKFGFILGEDGSDYFFHISNVKSINKPLEGAMVEFEPEKGERGLVGKNVKIQEQKNKPEFIMFGEVRVKLNNIKNYGIVDENRYFEKVFGKYLAQAEKRYDNKILDFLISTPAQYEWTVHCRDTEIDSIRYNSIKNGERRARKGYVIENANYYEFEIANEWDNARGKNVDKVYQKQRTAQQDGIYEVNYWAQKDDVFMKSIPYLYVTTYQDDNYVFRQDLVSWHINEMCAELDRYLCY